MINLSECPLLQQIPDVWPIINYYYESYFPFAIGRLCNLLEQISLVQKNNYYREVTLEESKTDRFKKLFIHKPSFYVDNVCGIEPVLTRSPAVLKPAPGDLSKNYFHPG